MEPIVNFFVVGYPKSGSTTLYNLLRSHPNVFLPEFKEPKFFASDLYRESDEFHGGEVFGPVRKLEDYHNLYRDKTRELGIGDISPWYIYSKEAADNIFQYNPDAKIIILLREPISFLRSLHFALLAQLYENEGDFLTALSLEGERKQGRQIPATVQVPSYLFYSEWINYKVAIKRFTSLFGMEQVKIILFEDMIKNEINTVKDVLTFLNVNYGDYQFPEEIDRHPSHTVKYQSLWKFLKQPSMYRVAKKIIPVRLYGIVNKFLFKHLFEEKGKPPVEKEEIKRLKNKYIELVESTNEFLNQSGLINQDLISFWGYAD